MYRLEEALREISGFARVTLQPAAGAHGELCGLMMMRAYHQSQGRHPKKVLIPDSARHQSRFGSAEPVRNRGAEDRSRWLAVGRGGARRDRAAPGDIAGLMVTNPSTLVCLKSRSPRSPPPCMQLAAWSTWTARTSTRCSARCGLATSASIACTSTCTRRSPRRTAGRAGQVRSGSVSAGCRFCPRQRWKERRDLLAVFRPTAVDRPHAQLLWQLGMMVRAYTYIREMGGAGLTQATEMAVLNAVYLRARIADVYPVCSDRPSMHEVVVSDKRLKKETGVQTLDVAKRLMDYGYHPRRCTSRWWCPAR